MGRITKEDIGLFSLSQRSDSRVFLLEPMLDKIPVALLCAVQWLLTSDAELRQQPTNRIDAQHCTKLVLDQLRYHIAVNSHPTPTPLSRPKMTPYRRANVPSEGAETGGAEPPLAEQSRSWRAASGGLGD